MSQVAYNPYKVYDSSCFQPTDRFYVRSSVSLPNGDVDPETGLLKPCAVRRGRTQAMRMDAKKLDRDYDTLSAAVQKRQNEKGIRIPMRYGVLAVMGVLLLCATILLVQQGVLVQRRQNLMAMQERITDIQTENQALRAKIDEASDAAKICYAASQDLGMVPASSAQAIHLTAVDTRPGDNGTMHVSASAADAQNSTVNGASQ
jgi:cell division protein FtsL